MSRITRLLGVMCMGFYLIYLSYTLHLQPWLDIATIIMYVGYLIFEDIHAVRVREIEHKEKQLKWNKQVLMNKVVDRL